MPSQRTYSQSAETLKIGFLTVNTGPLAAGGKQQMEGAAFYLKERGGVIAGRKVELITQDTASNPALARTKTQELVERAPNAPSVRLDLGGANGAKHCLFNHLSVRVT